MDEHKIFVAARKHEDSGKRRAYLSRACGGDGPLRNRVERLLRLDRAERIGPLSRRPQSLLRDLDTVEPSRLASDSTKGRTVLGLVLDALEPGDGSSLGYLNHYRVVEVLGQGGFGVVLRAIDETLNRTVAIKVLSPLLATRPEHRVRFIREARAIACVRHENVVQVFGVDESAVPFIVMEFVDGVSLQQFVEDRGGLPTEATVRLATQIANGLHAAHSAGIVHRDIKPANIMLTETADGRVAKITDFGLAVTPDSPNLTQTGEMIGTPSYMSPEQALGKDVDFRSDLFSLGSVIHFMCSGAPPFNASSTLATVRCVAETRSEPVPPSVPAGLARAINRLHHRNPKQRPTSADAARAELQECLVLRWLPPFAPTVLVLALTLLMGLGCVLVLHQPEASARSDADDRLGYSAVPLASFNAKLAHRWSFEDDIRDTSPSGNHGRVVGGDGTAEFMEGRVGRALDLNSNEGILNINARNLPLGAGDDWTTNIWLRFDELPKNFAYMCGFGVRCTNALGQARAMINMNSTFHLWGSGPTADRDSRVLFIADGNWHMYTIVYARGVLSMYVDGGRVSHGALTLYDSEYNRVQVGNSSIWCSTGRGGFDEFTIWDGGLTDEEVATLYLRPEIFAKPR